MDKSRCPIHKRGCPRYYGFGYVIQVNRKTFDCRLTIEGTEYNARIRKDKIAEDQRDQNLANRYIYLLCKGGVVLCDCRYTQADLDKAARRADRLWRRLKVG